MVPPISSHELARDGQPQAGALLCARLSQLHEGLEQALLVFRLNAEAGIFDLHQQMLAGRYASRPAGWSRRHAPVNFTALPTRLTSIWCRRASSPLM